MWASCGSVENPPESEHGWHARASGVRRDGREWPGHKFGVAGAKTGLFRPRPGGSIRLPADPQLTLWAIVLRSYGAGSGAIRGSMFMPHARQGLAADAWLHGATDRDRRHRRPRRSHRAAPSWPPRLCRAPAWISSILVAGGRTATGLSFRAAREDGHRQSRDQGMRRANPRWLLCSRASPMASPWPEIGLGETYRLRRC